MSAISRYQIYHFLIINSWENGQNVICGDFFGPKNAQNSHFEGFWRQSAHVFYYFHNFKVKIKYPQKYLGGISTFTHYFRKNVGQNVANLILRHFAVLWKLNYGSHCIVIMTFFLDNFSFQLVTVHIVTVISFLITNMQKWAKHGI